MAHLTQLAIVLVLAIAKGALADEPEKIVGGYRASPGEFPYQVSLQMNGRHVCGGTLISNQHVLTAAHCVYGMVAPPYNMITIVTGVTNLYQGGQTHRVKNVLYHSRYVHSNTASWVNDIALVALHQPIAPSSVQRPIRIASSDTPGNTPAILSGFGMTQANGQISPFLLKSPMTIISQQQCQATHKETIYPSQLCAFRQVGVGACQGDSGGPLVANGELVGVVSWVYPCGIGVPDVYTRVFHHRDFIDEALRLSA